MTVSEKVEPVYLDEQKRLRTGGEGDCGFISIANAIGMRVHDLPSRREELQD